MNPDETIVIRTYASEPQASIAAARLESEGVEAFIHKDDCGGAYPSLQLSQGVRLLVRPEDREQAERILRGTEAEDSGEAESREPREDPGTTAWRPIVVVGAFVLGLAGGYFLSPELIDRSTYTGVIKSDRNEAGIPGRSWHYVNGRLATVEEDRNHDGKPDAWIKYLSDRMRTSTCDNNFDGRPDVWIKCKDEFNYIERVDADFDGKPDATYFYVHGLTNRVDWYPHDSAIIERRELYEHGLLKQKLVDTDGDGIFDLRITYDPYGRPTGESPCRIPN